MLRSLPLSLLVTLAAALPMPAAAQTVILPASQKTVTLDASSADIHTVVITLERQAGIRAIVKDGATSYKLVQVNVTGQTLSQTLQAVADSAGAKLTQNADGVYIFTPLLEKPLRPAAHSPRQVTVQWKIVEVPLADWKKLNGDAAQQAAAIENGHYPTVSSPTVTTTDGVTADMTMNSQVPFGPPEKHGFVTIGTATKFTPRLNTDGSITLQLSLHDTELAGPPAKPGDPLPTKTTQMTILRTFRPGETALLGNLARVDDQTCRAVLLTPTVKAPRS